MEINHDKCKILGFQWRMSNTMVFIHIIAMIYMYDKQIENVEHFKYLGAIVTNSGNSHN